MQQETQKQTELKQAWVGDAILSLFVRKFLLKNGRYSSKMDGYCCSNRALVDFVKSREDLRHLIAERHNRTATRFEAYLNKLWEDGKLEEIEGLVESLVRMRFERVKLPLDKNDKTL